ncbi:hypothetical protein HY639_00040 [Candidatus Woesearchaeota archaeon]|nr:hypothetical protein [Candidatus Woesearchaeota archaeon]
MRRHTFFLVALLVLSPVVMSYSWQNYEGVTQWHVTVSDDELGCGGGVKTKDYAVAIQHNKEIADVGTWGHGSARGTFAGNILRIPGRTIRDGAGNSKLSELALEFTLDCGGFGGSHRWDYADSMMRCSGSTTVQGKRIGEPGCPLSIAAQLRKDIIAARAEAEEALREKRYKDILAKDPKNFWANWDLAELKKKQGNPKEFFKYFDMAVDNEKIFPATKQKLKKETAEQLHLSIYPTKGTSPLLRLMTTEVDSWPGGFIHELNVPKEEAGKKSWRIKFWALLEEKANNVVNKLAGLPGEEE